MAFIDTNNFIVNSGNSIHAADSWTYLSTDTGSAATRLIVDTYNNTNTFGSSFRGRRARGGASNPSGVRKDDVFLQLVGDGYNPSSGGYVTAKVSIAYFAAEDWTGEANGTYMAFRTCPTGTAIVAERLRISPNGNVGINNFNPEYKLDVSGSGNFTAVYQQGNLLSTVSVTGSASISSPNFSGIGTTQVFRSGDFVLISGASSAVGAGEANTVSSSDGLSLVSGKVGVDIKLFGISGGSGVQIQQRNNTIFIDSLNTKPMIVPFSIAPVTLTNMPIALNFFNSSAAYVQYLDLSPYTGYELLINRGATAAGVTGFLQLKYLGSFNTTATNYLPLTAGLGRNMINVTNTFIKSGYQPIVNGARSGVYVALIGSGGDGVLDPIVNSVFAHFL